MSLSMHKFRAKRLIDQHAGDTRRRFVTDVPGQAAVYLRKHQQALEYLSAKPGAAVPGYIAAEAAASGKDAAQAAREIIQAAQRWDDVLGPAIEGIRLTAKRAVTVASDPAEVDRIVMVAVQAFAHVGNKG